MISYLKERKIFNEELPFWAYSFSTFFFFSNKAFLEMLTITHFKQHKMN